MLKTELPGIHDDFFELGGHSLAATQVLARLRQIFQTTLPIGSLFVAPTVARLSERVGEQMANLVADGSARLEQKRPSQIGAGEADAHIPRRHDTMPTPLSLGQQRIYFLDQLGSGAAYNMSASLWLTGSVDERALAMALDEIRRRHEILRATFSMRGEQPVQLVSVPQTEELPTIDLATHPASERTSEAMRLATAEAGQPFDLAIGPLFRAKLVRLSRKEAVLLLTMHHIVSDGWSIGVLYRELIQLYEAFRAGRPSSLEELPIQYGDFAAWQQRSVEQGWLDRQVTYWTRQLDNIPPGCTFPADRPRPAMQSYRGAIEQVFFDRQLIGRLKTLSRRENVTLFMTLLAAFKTLLFRYNGQDDCVVGVPIAGRPQKELESLIGFFANTLVLRTSLAGDPSFIELLARVRSTALGAYAHQDIPIERIMQSLRIGRDLARTPLFQVMFAFQNVPETSVSAATIDPFARPAFDLAPSLTVRPFRVDNKTAKFDLTLYLSEVNDGMSATWQFNTDLFEPATIHRIAWQFQTLLEGVAADPEQKLSELPLLSEADSHQIEIDWNRTETHQLLGPNFVQLFEAQVERSPNAVAVLGGDGQFTYRELNERANQLARYFHESRRRPGHAGWRVLASIGRDNCGAAWDVEDGRRISAARPRLSARTHRLHAARRGRVAPDHANGSLAESDFCGPVARGRPKRTTGSRLLRRQSNARRRTKHCGISSVAPAADGLAYVIYTSGSTGKPKGVMITHGNVCHYAQAMTEAVGIHSDDRYLHTASFSFSSSVRQFTVPLSCGAAVSIASTEELRDPHLLVRDDPPAKRIDPGFRSVILDKLPSGPDVARSVCANRAARQSRAADAVRERAAARSVDRRMAAAVQAWDDIRQHVWSDGNDRDRDDLRHSNRRRRGDDRSDRPADRQHAGLCAGRVAPPGSGRHLR